MINPNLENHNLLTGMIDIPRVSSDLSSDQNKQSTSRFKGRNEYNFIGCQDPVDVYGGNV